MFSFSCHKQLCVEDTPPSYTTTSHRKQLLFISSRIKILCTAVSVYSRKKVDTEVVVPMWLVWLSVTEYTPSGEMETLHPVSCGVRPEQPPADPFTSTLMTSVGAVYPDWGADPYCMTERWTVLWECGLLSPWLTPPSQYFVDSMHFKGWLHSYT